MDAGRHRAAPGAQRDRRGTGGDDAGRFTVTEMVDWKAWLSRRLTSSRGRVGDGEPVVSAAMSPGSRLIRDREEACPGKPGSAANVTMKRGRCGC